MMTFWLGVVVAAQKHAQAAKRGSDLLRKHCLGWQAQSGGSDRTVKRVDCEQVPVTRATLRLEIFTG